MPQITGFYSENVVTMKVFIFTNGRPCNLVVIYMPEEIPPPRLGSVHWEAASFRVLYTGGNSYTCSCASGNNVNSFERGIPLCIINSV